MEDAFIRVIYVILASETFQRVKHNTSDIEDNDSNSYNGDLLQNLYFSFHAQQQS